MAIDVVGIHFRRGDTSEVLDHMRALVEAADGRGWLNVQPWVDEEDLPVEPPFARAFSSKGPPVPTGTWIPAHRRRRKAVPTNVGLQHPAGRDAVRRLAASGVELPSETEVRQDHTRRGLVLDLGERVGPAEALEFILDAIEVLAAVPVDDRWVAEVLTRR